MELSPETQYIIKVIWIPVLTGPLLVFGFGYLLLSIMAFFERAPQRRKRRECYRKSRHKLSDWAYITAGCDQRRACDCEKVVEQRRVHVTGDPPSRICQRCGVKVPLAA